MKHRKTNKVSPKETIDPEEYGEKKKWHEQVTTKS